MEGHLLDPKEGNVLVLLVLVLTLRTLVAVISFASTSGVLVAHMGVVRGPDLVDDYAVRY